MPPSRMARRFVGALIVSLVVLCSVSLAGPAAQPARAQPRALSLRDLRQTLINRQIPATTATLRVSDVEPSDLIQGLATVTFDSAVSAADAGRMINGAGGTVASAIAALNVYQVRLPPSWSIDDGISSLAALPGVLRAEPLVRLRNDYHPNDPLYAAAQEYLVTQLDAEQAWDIQQGDPRIVVAVVDSGVDITHPDLAGQIWTNPNPGHSGCGNDLHGCNFVDPTVVDPACPNQTGAAAPNPDISPYFFHGTFVSGIVGATTNNGTGVAGIVPHASIMPVKVGDCTGPIGTSLANGILYAANNGAAVINLSIGGKKCNPMPSYVLNAINQAERMGVIVVAASGNDEVSCVGSPASYSGVIAVGAVSASGTARPKFSQWGPEIAVVAPGQRVISTIPVGMANRLPRGVQALAVPNDSYAIDDGTSYSTPMVSGLADLLLSQNPLLTPAMVKTLIQRGATPLADNGEPGWSGAGRIDLAASLRLVPAGYYGTVRLSGAAVPNGTAVQARIGQQLCGQGTTVTVQGQATYTVFVAPATDQTGCGAAGAMVSFTVNGTPAGATAWTAGAVSLDLPAAAPALPVSTTVQYRSGWNLVAAPAGTTFTGAQGPLFTLQAADSVYETVASGGPVQAGLGYWAYFAADAAVVLPADGGQQVTIMAPPGRFVMAGNPSSSRAVTVVGADVVYTYDPGARQYIPTTTLRPGQGAWVYSAAGGPVTLQ